LGLSTPLLKGFISVIRWLARAMQLQWGGPKMEDSHMYFYLEVWRELSTFLADRKKANVLKSKRQVLNADCLVGVVV